jgi:transposase
MAFYLGLDVSDKTTHLCAVDDTGGIGWRGICATDPETIARTIARHCGDVARLVLETGALSAFLYHGLIERGVPAVCICARHAKGVLSTRSNKSDPHDAEGLAQLARTGWFKAIHIKDDATHLDRAQLRVREQMVKAHRSMLGQLRGLLKLFGLRLGGVTTPARRAERLVRLFEQKPELKPILRLRCQFTKSTNCRVSGDAIAIRMAWRPPMPQGAETGGAVCGGHVPKAAAACVLAAR